jgi:hypothetical protein
MKKKPQSYSEACEEFRKALVDFGNEIAKALQLEKMCSGLEKWLRNVHNLK